MYVTISSFILRTAKKRKSEISGDGVFILRENVFITCVVWSSFVDINCIANEQIFVANLIS